METKIELIELAQSVDATRRAPAKKRTAARKPRARATTKRKPRATTTRTKRKVATKPRAAVKKTAIKKDMKWWKSLTVKQKKAYLKEHPRSKYGKATRADGSAKKGLELRATRVKRKVKVTTKAKSDSRTAKAVKTKRRSKTAIPKSWAWFHPGAKKAVRKTTKVTTAAKRDTKTAKAVKRRSATKKSRAR